VYKRQLFPTADYGETSRPRCIRMSNDRSKSTTNRLSELRDNLYIWWRNKSADELSARGFKRRPSRSTKIIQGGWESKPLYTGWCSIYCIKTCQ